MKYLRFTLVGLFLVLLSSFVSALVTCSTDSFDSICSTCSFTKGRVDPTCKDAKEESAKTCLATSYPVMSVKYGLGMCDALDKCVEKLRSCNNILCAGNDESDCNTAACRTCYLAADRCAKMAARDCADKEKCGNNICSDRAGEDKDTCCIDCGCETGYQCINEICQKPENPQTSEIQPISDDDTWDMIYDLDVLGCIPFLMLPITALTSMLAKIIGMKSW